MSPLPAHLTWHRTLLLCAALLALSGPGCTGGGSYRDTPFVPDAAPDAPKSVTPGRKWQEAAVTLPAWPRDEDLVEVKVDGPEQPLTHYIDTRSLKTGADGVVRYTLVSKSATGARNVSFEGLRCTPKGRWKTYAYGIDGRFEPAADTDAWWEIRGGTSDRLHFDLWRHYLCIPRAFAPRPEREQVHLLRSGRVPGSDNAGFITQ